MAREPSPEIDDELFNEIYGKEYTGPVQPKTDSTTPKGDTNKRPFSGSQSDDEDEPRDPNAVPTDFTSREAKVWEAKAKATERNWKKRKEEEMICKICGESGHFTQGCPSTLGANRKTADFFERVPARDKSVRALFSEKVINKIEKDVGCKIKMDEKFLIVSGKNRLILGKGVDAVHKVIQDGKDRKGSPSRSNKNDSRSPEGSPKGSYPRRSEPQTKNPSRFPGRGFNQERPAEDHVHQEPNKMSRDSPRAYANDGGKGRQMRSKSPLRPNFSHETFRSYDGRNNHIGVPDDRWDVERRRIEQHPGRKFDFHSYPQSLEELEMEFKNEVMELGRIRDQEEDEENYKHRECIKQLREDYLKKLAILRGMHMKQWEEFLQLDIQRQQQARQAAYNQPSFAEYDLSSRNMQYVRSGLPRETTNRYQFPAENYSVQRPHEAFREIQHQRHEDFGNTYSRY